MTVNPRGDRPIKQERSDRIKRYLEISAALAAIVGLVAAVYFPIRGEKHKAVELRYLAKLSLVSPEATTSGKVKVAYDNRVVENPTKLSARLGNSGDLPIEAKDIEQPLVLLFEGVRILNAEITERSPGDIRAAVQYTDKTVTLEHGLLNPGDYLLFEILSDGDKGWPKPQVRIAGISKLLLTFPTTQSRRDKVLFLDLQRHWQYAVLGIASVVPVAALVVFLLASWDSIRIGVSPPDIRTEIDTAFNKDEIASDCFMNGYDSKKADSQLFGLVSDFASLDDPTALADRIRGLPADMRAGGDPRVVAERIVHTAKQALPEVLLRRTVFIGYRFYKRVRWTLSGLEFDPSTESARHFIARAEAAVLAAVAPPGVMGRLRLVEWGQLMTSFIVLAFGTALALVCAGAWRPLLGGAG